MPKQSYMDKRNIINEGFFDKLKQFFNSIPKKLKVTSGLKKDVNNLNKALSHYDTLFKKRFGNEYPDFPKFKPEDFVR